MKKTLYDLTKEDWNTLYPIELVNHNPKWKEIYNKEKNRILKKVGSDKILRIEHFGSSSIPGIKSKPYIDILIEIPSALLFDKALIDEFAELGYTHFEVPERENIKAYSSFGRGYHPDGTKKQIFHIHMCPKENVMWNQLKFRDYLRENVKRAKEYEQLKVKLATKFRNDRGNYMLNKTEFIKETLELINRKN